jgi:hypothetical protein
VSVYNAKNFQGKSPDSHWKKKGGRGREERVGKGKRGEGSIPQIKFYDYSTGHWANYVYTGSAHINYFHWSKSLFVGKQITKVIVTYFVPV